MRIAWKIGVVLTLVVSGPAAAEANGVIKEDYKSPSGNRPEMSGNAKNRHLEVTATSAAAGGT